jgi:hypothetical protein
MDEVVCSSSLEFWKSARRSVTFRRSALQPSHRRSAKAPPRGLLAERIVWHPIDRRPLLWRRRRRRATCTIGTGGPNYHETHRTHDILKHSPAKQAGPSMPYRAATYARMPNYPRWTLMKDFFEPRPLGRTLRLRRRPGHAGSLGTVAAGWPLFGQFVAHDITADRSPLRSHVDPTRLQNARAPPAEPRVPVRRRTDPAIHSCTSGAIRETPAGPGWSRRAPTRGIAIMGDPKTTRTPWFRKCIWPF